MSEPRKYSRQTVGSIYKSKVEGASDYLKVNLRDGGTLTLKHGDTLQVETKKSQLDSLNRANEAGKVGPEQYQKALERINRIPEFVRAEVVLVTKN